ncbi:MAG: dihydrolipoyl dehydrogenase [Alphaproteobacteria bacterium]|nr:dihydrolipoyl dehydrogenase [Alphaproteobacteria bacterium]TAD89479.1 MAG: dihydrolipoyl dehydrogenase [Alphaproteobacteria bacterium]
MSDTSFDVIVVGGGPGGYVAAIRAAQLKMKVALVEREHLGGVCLNWGCIPTKALLRSSEIYHLLHNLGAYGFSASNISFDLGKIVGRSRQVAGQLSGGIKHLMKKNKVTVFDGHGRLGAKAGAARTVEVLGPDGKVKQAVTGTHVILATGARARHLPGFDVDGGLVWTAREAMVPDRMPKQLVVIGSGAIGIEFASFYRTMGAEVTVVEMMDRILPVEDEEVSAFMLKAFAKQGMKILTGATTKGMTRTATGATVTVEQAGKSIDLPADRIIVAIGIVGNVEGIGLEGTKVKVEKTHIVTDGMCRTDEPGIYAIGDLTGPPWLAHKASHEGVICVEAIAGLHPHAIDVTKIPGCTYCWPQVASVGLTEAKAKAAGHQVKVGRFPYVGNGKAIALGEPEGMVKTVFDAKTGELLGAHMVGAEVTELIQGYGIARTLETTEADLMHTVFPHPTLSEMMHESVLDAYGRALHF